MVLTDVQLTLPLWAIPVVTLLFIAAEAVRLRREWREMEAIPVAPWRAARPGSRRRFRQLFFSGVLCGFIEGWAITLRPSARAAPMGWQSSGALGISMGIIIAVAGIILFWEEWRARRKGPNQDVEAFSMGIAVGLLAVSVVLGWFTL